MPGDASNTDGGTGGGVQDGDVIDVTSRVQELNDGKDG